jgi:hypothetical protein
MSRLKRLILIAGLSSRVLHAQVDLPELYTYEYVMSGRDPFISKDAPKTLLNDSRESSGIVSGDVIGRYLESIVRLIKGQLYVGGVSIGDTQIQSIALINGVAFRVGDKVPLEVSKKDLQNIEQLAASYGLPSFVNGKDLLNVEVGRVTERGVDLVLPGFKAAIYHLPLPTDEASEAIRLQRKVKKPTAGN